MQARRKIRRAQSQDTKHVDVNFEAPPVAEMDETRVVRPTIAYKNNDFLLSRGARTVRILAEHEEAVDRLRANGVKNFVLVRGAPAQSLSTDRCPLHIPSACA